MMELWMDTWKVLLRIVTILPLLLAVGLFMGKRSIGELPVFDFVVVLVLGSVVGADIADPNINHIHTVTAIIAIALLQKVIVWMKLRSPWFGKLLTFEPTVVVFEGKMIGENVKRIRYSIDNIIQMLREKDVFRIEDVYTAIIEPDGRLTVQLKQGKEPVTREDIGIWNRGGGYDIPLIMDGILQKDMIARMEKTEAWVEKQITPHAVSDIFYGAVTNRGSFHYSLKGTDPKIPPIEH
ncbi:DUF421 domain-containing protein [Bacillus sp. SB49]|uniref:DUF421 domain-containing protein n=1 Tax=Bacillus sp. SB49 TaxID=1071080 RepID=UPI000418CB51|nr:DUF421 domain-containing protein [Bacillus sp. SB49]QHT48381.1 DUF421 domain-containing protein [Bacillus sp. SB49]